MKLKKVSSFLLASAICLGLSAITANAAENISDGVKLVISADKSAYSADDSIVADIILENNSGSDITDIKIEAMIPENYHIADDCNNVLRSTYIMTGDSINSELVFIPNEKKSKTASKKAEKTAVDKKETVEVRNTAIVQKEKVPSQVAAEKTVSHNKTDNTDDSDFSSKLIIMGVILLGLSGAVIIITKKGKGKGLMIFFCITAAGTMIDTVDAKAADAETKNISVSEAVTVDNKQCELTANVEFTIEIPDMQAAVQEYYEDNSEEIVAVENVEETEEVFTEKGALQFLAERGFTEYPLTYDFNMDGTYVDEAEASPDSDEKHPMYQTYFVSDDNAIWSIFIIGRSIMANPASYNLESDAKIQILVSETDTLTSYTEMGNKLYTTIPKESAISLKVVDQITSQKLNDLKFEEVK